jgi:hypothetical protein
VRETLVAVDFGRQNQVIRPANYQHLLLNILSTEEGTKRADMSEEVTILMCAPNDASSKSYAMKCEVPTAGVYAHSFDEL